MTTDRNAPAAPDARSELIYQLDDTPDFLPAVFAALQHVLASFVAIITPTLIVSAVLQLMPKPVLGDATLIMFGTVAVAGIKIHTEAGLHRRNMLIVSISLGLGLGVAAVPEALAQMPEMLRNILGSPIAIGAFSAIALNIFLPEEPLAEDDYEPEAHLHTVLQNRQDETNDDSLSTLSRDLDPAPRSI